MGGTFRGLEGGLGLAATALLALGLAVAWPDAQPLSTALLGLAYLLGLAGSGRVLDWRAPLFAGGLLLAAELAHWSCELARTPGEIPVTGLRRSALIAALVLAACAAGASMVATAGVEAPPGVGIAVLGTAGAVAALALAGLLARRAAQPNPRPTVGSGGRGPRGVRPGGRL